MDPWRRLLMMMMIVAAAASATQSASLASPAANIKFPLPDDCQSTCGDINVSFPFGFKDGCFRPGFRLFCDNSTQPRKLFLGGNNTDTQVYNITYTHGDRPLISVTPLSQVVNISRDGPTTTKSEISLTAPGGEGTPYGMSDGNVVVVVGCGVRAVLIDGGTNEALGNCTSTCTDMEKIGGSCHDGLGEGCCKIPFPTGWIFKSFKTRLSLLNLTRQSSSTTIVKILVADSDADADADAGTSIYEFSPKDLDGSQNISGDNLRLSLRWSITDQLTCDSALRDKSDYACLSDHSYCEDWQDYYYPRPQPTSGFGYNCFCDDWNLDYINGGGNAYVPHGCSGQKCRNRICSKLLLGLIIGVSVGMALLLLTMLTNFISKKYKKIKHKKIKARNFEKNHGLLLQQLISSNEDIAERTKIFSLEEMEKATNNFDATRILGRGGHGTVYKGILADQRVVAIKKSKIVIKGEIDQFINEVAILSRINHRNIVRLFGCCLETEVPLLVYEFISNGTLHDHLHSIDAITVLSWEDRLRVATEAAAALAYLHCAAFISIFHRDVKSSNILLDNNLTAKVSDFGASRSIPDNETHIVTIVQGTYGYLDPQYYRTGELTEKSDVYSFGVILLELLTGKKPISIDLVGQERNLTTNFLRAINENRHFDLVDAQVQEEGKKEEIEYIAQLACMCINFESDVRPTMKEVEYRLQVLRRKTKRTQEHKEVTGEPITFISSHASDGAFMAGSSNQANEEASKNYSMEKYLMSSLDLPR